MAVVNVEPDMAGLRALADPRDPAAPVWDDDCVERFVSPDADHPERAFQIIVNAAGAVWAGAYGLEPPGPGLFGCQPAWGCEGLTAAVARTRTRRVAELAIPWAAIGLAGGALPPRIALNACRCRVCGGPPVHSAWSPPLREAHYNPERFGTVLLRQEPAPALDRTRLVPRSPDDVGSGAAAGPGWYAPGGVLNGQPFVGNPDPLTRRDRMVLRFDLTPFALVCGETGVREAVLHLIPVSFHGPDPVRRIEVSHLRYDTGVLSWKDVVNDRAAAVSTVEVHRDTACGEGLRVDVTEQVNADLRLGRAAAAFRLRDIGSEEGNPDMQPDGLCFPSYTSGALRLDVRP